MAESSQLLGLENLDPPETGHTVFTPLYWQQRHDPPQCSTTPEEAASRQPPVKASKVLPLVNPNVKPVNYVLKPS